MAISGYRILRIDKELPFPTRKTEYSSGIDLHARINEPIQPNALKRIPTGIKMIIPVGYEVQIRPRSGLANDYSITVLNTPGTIDSDYRGEICVLLYNAGAKPFFVIRGDRIAQAVLCPVVLNNPVEVTEEEFNEFTTVRGEGGFGSTGMK